MHKTRFVFVALALLAMLPTGASAQIDVGFQAGVNLYKLTGDSISAADSLGTLKGINIGVTVAVPVSDLFSVHIGLAYSQQGTAANDFFGDSINAKVKINYIDIPVLAKISPSMDGALGVDFFVGPSIGFKIGCKLSSSSTLFTGDCDSTTNDIQVKSTQFSIVGGAGINYAVGSGSLLLQGFYNYGLTNIDDSATPDPADPNAYNRGWSILVGYSMPVGG